MFGSQSLLSGDHRFILFLKSGAGCVLQIWTAITASQVSMISCELRKSRGSWKSLTYGFTTIGTFTTIVSPAKAGETSGKRAHL